MHRNARTLLYASNLWYLGEGMLGPLFAVFTEKIGGSILDISWAWATYLMVTGLLIVAVGELSDKRFSKEKLLVVGYTLNALITFAYLLVSKPWHLFLVQAGLGLAAALSTPTWDSLYSRYEDREHDGHKWGIADGEAQLVTGVAVILGGLIVTYASFAFLFVTMGVVQIIATFVQFRILKSK